MPKEKAEEQEQATPDHYVKALKLWRDKPIKYVDDMLMRVLETDFEPQQREVIEAVFRERRLLCVTHFSFGKSFICSLIALTIANLYPHNCIGSTFAPTFRQVRDILWREMNRIFETINKKETILNGDMNVTRYSIGKGALVVGFSPNKGAKGSGANTNQSISGRHDRVVFVIVDEAGGVSRNVFEQIEALQASGEIVYVVYIGNPLDLNGEFGQLCTTEKGMDFFKIHKTAYTHPNMIENKLTSVDALRREGSKLRGMDSKKRMEYFMDKHYKKPYPSLISPGFVMKCYLKWGESPLFFSYCIGEWAQILEDTLVTLARANECMLGSYRDEDGIKVWAQEVNHLAKWNKKMDVNIGIDCSDEGSDSNTLYALEGNREFEIKDNDGRGFKKFPKTWDKNEIDYRGTSLKEDGPYIAAWIYDHIIKPNPGLIIRIGIDCTGGFGKSIYESLMAYKLEPVFITIKKIHFASKAIDNIQYHDIIAEMAIGLAKQFNSKEGLLLEPNDDLKNQITNRRTVTEQGKLRKMIERKPEYKKRAGQSPDDFDALMMAWYMASLRREESAVDDLGKYYDAYDEDASRKTDKTW